MDASTQIRSNQTVHGSLDQVIKSNISSSELANLQYRRPASLESRLPALPVVDQSDCHSSKIIEVDFAPPDTGIMSLNTAKDPHHFGLATMLGLPTHEFVSKNGKLNHNCGRYRFLKISTKSGFQNFHQLSLSGVPKVYVRA